jgi:tRNA dimethylallyltransferase
MGDRLRAETDVVLEHLRRVPRKPAAVLIAGPTASGKSALATALAQALDGVVVNADSMQIYSDLRVLSARPDQVEEATVPHRLYGFVPATEPFSVGRYIEVLNPVLHALHEEGRTGILVGGTGLYFRAIVEGLAPTPAISDVTRQRVAALRGELGAGGFRGWLIGQDPASANLAPADEVRQVRAAEVLIETGRTLADWRGENTPPLLAPGDWCGFWLERPREALKAAIDQRFLGMVRDGALEEAERLRSMGLPPNIGVMKAHGLPHLIRHLEGQIGLAEAIALGQADTRRYAKRQQTWARRFMADWVRVGGG